ncbi:MAG: hypothetical protein FJ134_10075 [Deltaproteobacteria bacterium]|nr:hypothetical protein [Deltaproteobacteria bacterium]
MRRFIIFIAFLLVAALVGSFTPLLSQAQDIRINPMPPKVLPQWTKVQGAPGVYYAPNIPTDVFRYQKTYYFFWEGYLYKSKSAKGPWKTVSRPPDVFYKIDPAYFKTVKQEAPPSPGVPAPAPPAAPAPPGSQ